MSRIGMESPPCGSMWSLEIFQEGMSNWEGNSALITFDDLHPVMIDKLIHYIYNSDYDDTGYWLENDERGDEKEPAPGVGKQAGKDEKGDPEARAGGVKEKEYKEASKQAGPQQKESQLLALNAGMYIIGDRFDLSHLKDLAKEKLSAALTERWDKEDLPYVIRTIYDNTLPSDRGLRDCLVPAILQHKKALREDEDFMNIVETHGDFAVDLIDVWSGGKSSGVPKIMLTSSRLTVYGHKSASGQNGKVNCPDCDKEQTYSFQ
ncbi:MAG: hypothetical protein Q9207_000364 [Kuettlingeria erythrocarpa]